MTWQQQTITTAGFGVVFLGLVFSVLAYASDRFDSGLSAGAIKDQLTAEQIARDKVQDDRLDKILTKLDGLVQPPSPTP